MLYDANSEISLLFCAGDSLLSRTIRWGLKEPASHVALDVPGSQAVIHSDLLGLHLDKRCDFMAAHEIVSRFRIRLTARSQIQVSAKLLRYVNSTHEDYDFGAFAGLTVAAIKSRLTGVPFPRTSPWGNDRELLCTEIAYLLNQALVEVTGRILLKYDTELDALSPWRLYQLLREQVGGQDEIDFRMVPSPTPSGGHVV